MPFTPKISAQVEVLIIQYNAIVKVMRSKKFKQELYELDNEAWYERRCVYEDRQIELNAEIERLTANNKVEIWSGILGK